MNLLQIRTESRRRVAELSATASYSSDDDFNAYINEGIKDMCIKGKVYEKTLSTLIVNDVANYQLPLDYLSIRAIYGPNYVALDPVDATGLGRVFVVSGKPLNFFISNFPLPLSVRGNNTIYKEGDVILPSTVNGYMYEVVVGGESGVSPPTFPTSPGVRVVDGTLTLLCRWLANTGYRITFIDTPTDVGGGTGEYSIIYFALANGLYVDTSSPDFPEDKHHILVMFAAFRHFIKMKDGVRAQGLYADYASALGLNVGGGK